MLAWSTTGTEVGLTAAAALAATAAGVVAYGTFAPRSRLFGPVVSRAPASEVDAVALTFDDGPWPGSTDAILDVLGRERIQATFFVIGRYALQHPALVRRIVEDGHLLGNHTFDHSRAGMFNGRSYWIDQIRRTNGVVRDVTGQAPLFFRPPMGLKSPPVMRAAEGCGCRVVTWTRRAFDGVPTTPERIGRNLAGAKAGEILLLHDGRDPASRREMGATVLALPRVIAGIRARGLAIVRLDHLLETPVSPARDGA